MNRGKAVFVQPLSQVPFNHFKYLVDVCQANKEIRHFSAWSQYLTCTKTQAWG